MKTDMKIAIVGAGPTRLAAALFLAEAGFNPTIFERFDAPKAIGSGLMIQPTGLSCLADLGLSEAAIEHSARIEGIYGDTPKGKVIFDIPYDVLGGTSFALGMHRGVLFDVLFEKLSSLNLAVETSHRIVDCLQSDQEAWLLREDATEIGPFDLVIDASGTG